MKSAISWFDIPTLDFERAVKFYSEVLGKPLTVDKYLGKTLAFFPMEKDGEVGGDIVPPSDDFTPPASTNVGTRVYLNCFDPMSQTLSRVEEAGGRVLQPLSLLGDIGVMAMIMDTEGNTVGFFSPEVKTTPP